MNVLLINLNINIIQDRLFKKSFHLSCSAPELLKNTVIWPTIMILQNFKIKIL